MIGASVPLFISSVWYERILRRFPAGGGGVGPPSLVSGLC